ncbi:MAG: hypothetical protein AB1689_00485 [Thermodesulfobacteriota bacterium]
MTEREEPVVTALVHREFPPEVRRGGMRKSRFTEELIVSINGRSRTTTSGA